MTGMETVSILMYCTHRVSRASGGLLYPVSLETKEHTGRVEQMAMKAI